VQMDVGFDRCVKFELRVLCADGCWFRQMCEVRVASIVCRWMLVSTDV